MKNSIAENSTIKCYKVNNEIMIGSFKGRMGSKGRTRTFIAMTPTKLKNDIPTGDTWLSLGEAKRLNANLTKLISAVEA